MTVKFSVADYSFPSIPFPKTLDLISLLEFPLVDLGLTEYKEGIHLPMMQNLANPDKSGASLRHSLEDHGLQPADIFLFTLDTCNSPDRAVRQSAQEKWARGIEYAAACGAKHLTVTPGIPDAKDPDGAFGRSSEALNALLEKAQKAQITAAIEPHTSSVTDTPDKVEKLLAMTPGLTLTLDYSHFIRDGFSQDQVHKLIPHASHMHFRHAAKGRLQTRSDESEIDYSDIVHHLVQLNYAGTWTIEYCVNAWEKQNEVDVLSELWKLRILLNSYIR